MLTITNSMRSVTADTTRVTEVVKSHVPVLNTLGLRDNFGRFRFVVRLTPTRHEISLVPSTSLRGKRESSGVGGKRQAGMEMMVRPWLEMWIRLKRE
jgi:hypothetical protein